MATKKPKIAIKVTQEKIDEVINKQIDKIIDNAVDKTLKEIDDSEKQSKKKTKEISQKNQLEKNKENNNFEKNKFVFALSYFLFFVSLIFVKEDKKSSRFYANQGLVLLISTLIGSFIFNFCFSFIHKELALILSLIFYVIILAYAVFGFSKTMAGEKEVILPIIGKIKLIK